MIMLTRSSEKIYNPMRYTGYIFKDTSNFCKLLYIVLKYFLNVIYNYTSASYC